MSHSRIRHFLIFLLSCSSSLASAATLTVNSTADTTTPGDGSCTLREAIINTNNGGDTSGNDCAAGTAPGADQINFSIAGGGNRATITMTDSLPVVIDPLTIDGNSQCGTPPCIELDGSSVADPGDFNPNALTVDTGSSVIRGLVFTNWPFGGIQLQGATGGNLVEGNYFGVAFDGTTPAPMLGTGIEIKSPDNTVGGITAAARNLTSANGRSGITIVNTASTNASGNTISGNYVGTDITGTVDLGNALSGIYMEETSNNTIGGLTAGSGNLISGNNSAGIMLRETDVVEKTTTGNLVQGNLIGTDVSGTLALGNHDDGVRIWDASGNTIGGTSAAARNVISGNGFIVGSRQGVIIFQTNFFNVPTNNNLVQGNFIGVDITGTVDLGNAGAGIVVGNAGSNTIGGTAAGAGNVISGNDWVGVYVYSEGLSTTDNMILGNRIGTNEAGTAAVGNAAPGVYLHNGSSSTTIGGAVAGAGNIISGNSRGVHIQNSINNTVQGNSIGTNAAGNTAVPNLEQGIVISDSATGNLIGGTTAGAGNLVSGNVNNGIGVYADSPGNTYQANFIGTDAAGTTGLPNGGSGIATFSSGAQTIGGDDPMARNVISGNVGQGIILQTPSTGNIVKNNYIGVGSDGTTSIPNINNGILLVSTSANQIGGNGVGNRIWNNVNGINLITGSNNNQILYNNIQNQSNIGIVLVDAAAGNTISRNVIYNNAALGIDLAADGPTANDNLDPDPGPNLLQNFPILSTANVDDSTVTGSLNSLASTQFTIEYFASAACDSSGWGEGQIYLGAIQATTDGSGNIDVGTTLGNPIPGGYFVTATATAPDGSTSEFSSCVVASDVLFSDGFEAL